MALFDIWAAGYLVGDSELIAEQAIKMNQEPIEADTFGEAVQTFTSAFPPEIREGWVHEPDGQWRYSVLKVFPDEQTAMEHLTQNS